MERRRRPSRQMPPYRFKQDNSWLTGLAGVLLCTALLSLFLLCLFRHPWLLLLCPLLYLYVTLSHRAHAKHLYQTTSARAGEDIGTFARQFDFRSIDTWVIRAVYEQFQANLSDLHPAFPLRADDRLEELLADPEELEDLAEEVAQRTGRSLQGMESNPHSNNLTTLRDVVLLFDAQPQST